MSGGETPLERHLQTLPSVWNGETAAYYFTRFSRRTFYWDIAIWLPPRAKMLRPGPTQNRGGWGGLKRNTTCVLASVCVCGLMWTMSWKFNRINTIVSPQPCGDSPTSQHLKSNCLFLFFFIQKNKYIYVQFQGFEIGGVCVCVFFCRAGGCGSLLMINTDSTKQTWNDWMWSQTNSRSSDDETRTRCRVRDKSDFLFQPKSHDNWTLLMFSTSSLSFMAKTEETHFFVCT